MRKFNVLALVFLIASWTSFAFAAGGGPSGGGSGGTPGGAAGGVLSGNYPNPAFSTTAATFPNNVYLKGKVSGGTSYHILGFDSTDNLQICDPTALDCPVIINLGTNVAGGDFFDVDAGQAGQAFILTDPHYSQGNTYPTDTTYAYFAEDASQASGLSNGGFGFWVNANPNTNSFPFSYNPGHFTANWNVASASTPQGYRNANFAFNATAGLGNADQFSTQIAPGGTLFDLTTDHGASGLLGDVVVEYDPLASTNLGATGALMLGVNPPAPTNTASQLTAVLDIYGMDNSTTYQTRVTGAVTAVTGQTADLFDFRKVDKTVYSGVDATGHFFLNGSTSGKVIFAAPAVAGTPTLTAPTTSGTLLTNATKGAVFASGTLAATDSATVGCTDTSTAVTNATTAMTVVVSPVGAPAGTGASNITWQGFATAGNITIRVCTIVVVTAAATTYNYVVLN